MSTATDRAGSLTPRGCNVAPADVADQSACWPTVGVVIPTRGRPELVRHAVAAALTQDYPGAVEVVVVFDAEEPDQDLLELASSAAGPAARRVRVLANGRTPGLAGTRNTGICSLETELVAFCDDDDTWAPGKLTAQVKCLQAHPEAEMATCSILITFAGTRTPRRAGRTLIGYQDLLASRMAMLHSSTFLLRRAAIQADAEAGGGAGATADSGLGIGLLDETIPGSQNEDWDLLLRAARRGPIVHVDEPMVQILWGQSSYFSRQWETRVASLLWMLARHPAISGQAVGAARVYGQLAFGYAVLGRRRQALRWALRAFGRRWSEPRAFLAVAVAARLLSGERVLTALHRRGRGI